MFVKDTVSPQQLSVADLLNLVLNLVLMCTESEERYILESGDDGKIVFAFFQSFLKVLAACPTGTGNLL